METLTERANLAAQGHVFSDPKVDPKNPVTTLAEWVKLSQPTGEIIEPDRLGPSALADDEPVAAIK